MGTLVTCPALADVSQTREDAQAAISAQEVIEDEDTLTTSAFSFIAARLAGGSS